MRFRPRRVMLLALAAAALFGAARIGGAPGVGTMLVAGSAATLAYRTYRDELDRPEAEGSEPSRRRKAGLLLRSSAYGAAIIGGSTLAFIIIFQGYRRLADNVFLMSHHSAAQDPIHMAIGAVIGTTLALRVASALDRTLGQDRTTGLRRWILLWPVALVILLVLMWGTREMRVRHSFCRMMARYHAARSGDGMRDEALHAWLARRYEMAALRPWLPIHPDRIPARFDAADP